MAFFITACMLVFVDFVAIFLLIENKGLRKENAELRACLPILSPRKRENRVMRPIRGLVYKMGFRPKPGSIFYSPSRDLMLKAKDAIRNWDTTQVIVLPDDNFRIEKREQPQ